MGFRFYLLSTILIATLFISGHLLGSIGIIKYIGVRFDLYGRPLGEEALTLGLIGFLFGMITGVTGIVVAVTILHKLSKKYFVGVRFGRTILLSLLTTFLLLFLYLLFWPK